MLQVKLSFYRPLPQLIDPEAGRAEFKRSQIIPIGNIPLVPQNITTRPCIGIRQPFRAICRHHAATSARAFAFLARRRASLLMRAMAWERVMRPEMN